MTRNTSTSRRSQSAATSGTPTWLQIVIGIALVILVGGIVTKLLMPTPPPNPDPHDGNPNRPVAAAPKAAVSIILDNSDSMKGYAQSAAFINILSDIEGISPNTKFCLTDSTQLKGDWIHQLRNGQVAFVSRSLLHADLAMAVTNATKDHVAVLVTDGIMSGSNEQLRQDPDYNLVHANKELKNGITQALRSAGKKHVAVAVYEFMVPFSGTYYCYNNAHGTLSNALRRFYAIAVGGPEALAFFHQRMEALNAGSRPLHAWMAIDPLPLGGLISLRNDDVSFTPSEKGQTLFFTNRQKWTSGHHGLTILLDAGQLLTNQLIKPEELQKATTLEARVDGVPCTATATMRGEQLAISIPDEYIPGGDKDVEISLQLNLKSDALPEWVTMASTDNDSSMLQQPNSRTFLFDRLMEGLRAGLPTRTGKCLYSERIVIRNG